MINEHSRKFEENFDCLILIKGHYTEARQIVSQGSY